MKSTVIKRFCALYILVMISQWVTAQDTPVIQNQEQKTAEKLKTRKVGVANVLFSGVLLQNKDKNQVWYFPNVFEWFPANTVEGFVVNPQLVFTQNLKGGRFFSIHPNLRYGVGNERFHLQLKTQYYYQSSTNGSLVVSGGRGIEQLFRESTLSALNNTLYTFTLDENFLKIYERSYVELQHAFSPLQNFLLTTGLSYNERKPLSNLPRYEEDEKFTSNNPENAELMNTAFVAHKAVLFEARLRWQIGHRRLRKQGQLISEGKYPALTIHYAHATDDILGGELSYQKLAFSIQDEFKLGKGYGKGFVEAGDFLSKDNLTFIDFKHFKGKETVYGTYDNDQFQLLEYYRNSTAEFYIQGHYEHFFGPIRGGAKSKFQPVASLHYLYTDSGGQYVEVGIGMDRILKYWRIDFYNSWRKGEHENFGLRLGLRWD